MSLLWTSNKIHRKPLHIISLAARNLCSEQVFRSLCLCLLLGESGHLDLSFVFFFFYGSRFAYLTFACLFLTTGHSVLPPFLKRCCRAQKTHPGKLVASVEGTDDLCGGILAKGIWIKRHADSHFALLLEFYGEKPLVVTGCVTRAVHYYRVNFVIQLGAATWSVGFRFVQEL